VNFSLDGGETWKSLKDNPRYRTGPVDRITVPRGSIEGH
jgi:hypothetical protein